MLMTMQTKQACILTASEWQSWLCTSPDTLELVLQLPALGCSKDCGLELASPEIHPLQVAESRCQTIQGHYSSWGTKCKGKKMTVFFRIFVLRRKLCMVGRDIVIKHLGWKMRPKVDLDYLLFSRDTELRYGEI